MAVTASPIYPQTVIVTPVTIVNADASNKKTLFTAGANGSKIEFIYATNTDTGAYTINLYITQSGTDYLIGTVSIPLSAGNTTSAPTVNVLNGSAQFPVNRDENGNFYLFLSSGSALKAASTTTVTAAKTVTFVTVGGDY